MVTLAEKITSKYLHKAYIGHVYSFSYFLAVMFTHSFILFDSVSRPKCHLFINLVSLKKNNEQISTQSIYNRSRLFIDFSIWLSLPIHVYFFAWLSYLLIHLYCLAKFQGQNVILQFGSTTTNFSNVDWYRVLDMFIIFICI
jgi:hypothetical protein